MMPEGQNQASPPSAVGDLITEFEDQLLERDTAWLEPTAKRMHALLSDSGLRAEFRDWLRLASSPESHKPESHEPLSAPVQKCLTNCGYGELKTRNEAASNLSERLSVSGSLDADTSKLAVVLGLQYVVLRYLPGLREFRGSILKSNLLPNAKLTAVCEFLRVPHKRGAVDWMSSLLLRESSEGVPFVVTLHDAALDLRGRVAAEDLVLGNRSVSGFVVLGAIKTSFSGYFFISHPVPGLFVDEKRPSDFEQALGKIYQKWSVALASAIEADLMTTFGELTLQRSEDWNRRGMPELGAPPIMSLSSESPTGFLAALVAAPVRDPMSARITDWSLSCQINEEPYIESIWSLLQLTSTFFGAWSDRVARHLKCYAELLSEPSGVPNKFPRMAWIPQYRTTAGSHTVELLERYYPEGVLSDLNRWIAERIHGDQWVTWHLSSLREAEKELGQIEKPTHQRLNAALAIYAGEEASYTDLVVPLFAPKKHTEQGRVVGFLRFNCDPGPSARKGRSAILRDDLEKFRTLYHIIRGNLHKLDASIGALFAWTDLQLQSLSARSEQSRIRAYKQTSDAARVLSDWIVSYFGSVLSGANEDARPSFEIVRYVFEHLSGYMTDRQPDEGEGELDVILQGIPGVFAEIGNSLRDEALPEIPIITLWLQTSRPVIDILPSGDDTSGDFADLADLFERDPGLPQLLNYISYARTWSASLISSDERLDLLSRTRLGPRYSAGGGELEVYREGMSFPDFSYLLDLGVPPKDSGLSKLEIMAGDSIEGHDGMTLCWEREGDDRVKKLRLRWAWSLEPHATKFHPYPAAVKHVQWKVSRRVGSVVAHNARVKIVENLNSPRTGIALSNAFKSETVENDLQRKLTQLEDSVLDPSSERHCWRAIPVAREGLLLMLTSSEPTSTMIEAFRATALAYERGAYLAWILGEDSYQERSMAERLAAIGHGYTGPVGHLRHEMMMAKTYWDSLETLDTESVSCSMKEFIGQAGAIIKLGGAAIEFARMEVANPEFEIVSGRSVLDQIRLVASAYQPREKGVITLSIADDRLAAFEAHLAPLIFIHGLSKLLDNAVKAARAPLAQGSVNDGKVLLALRLESPNLLVEIANSGSPLTEDNLERIRRGLLSGDVDDFLREPQLRPPLGLREAWKCFQRLGINVGVVRSTAPFVISITLEIRPSR